MKRWSLALAACAAIGAAATSPADADPMRPLPPPAGAASAPAATANAPAAPRREAAAPAPARDPGRLIAIREDDRGRRQALIGERWVGEGDRLEGVTVRSIEPNSVELVDGKAHTVLHLLPPLVASRTPAETTVAAGNGGPLPARAPRAPLRRSAAPTPNPPEGSPR